MIYTQRAIYLFFVYIFLSNQNSFASEKGSPHPKLVMHGETYENSCSAKQKRNMASNIQKNTPHDSRLLQNTIEFILCGSGTPQNINRMIDAVDEVVTTSYEGTGEEKVVGSSKNKIDILKDVMAKGKAWNVSLNFDDSEVTLQYFSSEACVESVKLRHSNSLWLIHGIGGACD